MRRFSLYLCGVAAALSVSVEGRAKTSPNAPQTLAAGTGLVMGQVVDADSGQPVGATVVTLGGALTQVGATGINQASLPGGPRRLMTNADGRFVFLDLPKGSYSIDVTKPGYAAGAYGRRRPGGVAQSLVLGDGERISDAKIPIWKFGAITGSVTDEAGEPVPGIAVWVLRKTIVAGRWRLSSAGSTVSTDDRGVYRATSVVPGDYVVAVGATQSTTPASVVDAYMAAQSSGSSAAFSRLMNSSGARYATSGTHVGDLVLSTAGNVGLTAVAPAPDDDGRLTVYPTTFYPGTTVSKDAQTITLRSAEERAGVDLQLQLLPAMRISGVVTGPDGPVGNLGLRLAATYSDEMVAETNFDAATTMTDATGAFTFLGVPSGAYSLRAIKVPPAVPAPASPVMNVIQTGSGTTSFAASPSGDQPASSSIPPGPTYWADVPVTVGDRDVSNLEVVLRDGFHITGRVEFDGTSDKPSASVIGHLLVTIDPIDGHSGGVPSPLQGEVGANQEIATYAVPPGKYFIRLSAFAADWLAMPGWSFRSATLDGHDVSDTPLAIDRDISGVVLTMTDHPSELSGTVRDSNGRGDMTPNVAVFPADPRSWVDYGSPLSIRRLRMVHVGRDGTYKFTSLPKGDYGLVAIPDEQSGEWQDLKMLEALAKVATKVTIVDGEKKTQDLRVSQVK